MTATNNDHDGHNHDGQLGEIYPTMLNEPNCIFGVSFSHFHGCGHHGHVLWSSWLWSPWYRSHLNAILPGNT